MPPKQQPADQPNSVDALPDWAQNMVRDLREENAKHRNKAKTAAEEAAKREQEQAQAARDELVQNIAQALGLANDPDDPQALLEAANSKNSEYEQQVKELTDQINTYRRNDAIDQAVGDRRVNKNLLKAVLAQDNAYRQIDVNADNFADQVSEAVNKALDANPELVQATRGQSGIDTSNTKNGDQPLTRDDLKTMSAEDINQAVRDGRLDHLLKR
ncbi:hypothetical protein C3E79_10110 [Corynebacterium liangguodongii]|uniref:Uncharacterized protein n=2 Tax=Corynebacterium liangguodongii TaxID=2079535 RepID=A0A2S0WGI4_9CORY|nr:hypothetical protein C3E79_10110 [Corynebacterium liangguodongii]PWB99140.1 hypothetical protein DF219_07725 [Corynebacterium liangguodongii]